MSSDKPDWEDQEQTIVSFPRLREREVARESDATDDSEKTILWTGEKVANPEADDDRTVVAHGRRRTEPVDTLAWLAITKTLSVRRGQVYPLEKARSDIGRGADVAIFLNDKKIGHTHATVKYETPPGNSSPEFLLYDLASANGTFVNGQRILAPVVLKDGDRIVVGETELVFKRI